MWGCGVLFKVYLHVHVSAINLLCSCWNLGLLKDINIFKSHLKLFELHLHLKLHSSSGTCSKKNVGEVEKTQRLYRVLLLLLQLRVILLIHSLPSHATCLSNLALALHSPSLFAPSASDSSFPLRFPHWSAACETADDG